MAVNNTISVKEYKLTGAGLTSFPITFEFTTDGSGNAENIHCQFATKNDQGEYSYQEEIAQGMGTDQFQVDGGNVKYIDDPGNEGQNNFIVIYRSTPPSQLTDFIDNGNYSLEDIEKALDKLTFLIQERTGTPSGTYINVGVSLFFANLLQLVSKKDALSTLFNWADIADEDHPALAGYIRSTLDAASRSLGNTFDGINTFKLVPEIKQDPTSSEHATRKSYVDSQITAAESYTDGKFPIGTSQISDGAVTTEKLKQTSGSQAVTTETIRDGAVTSAKIADGAVTLTDLRRGTATVTLTRDDDDYRAIWYNGGNKIVYGYSGYARCSIDGWNGQIRYSFSYSSSYTVTIYYFY